MAVLADFLDDVYELTNRPDLVAETTSALRRALLQAHFSGRYNFDLRTEEIMSTGEQAFISPLPNQYRMTNAIFCRADGNEFRLDEITPAAIFDPSVYMRKENCYYVAGPSLHLRVTRSFSALTHQYFRVPFFVDSYIADNYPHVLAQMAAAKIFALLVQPELATYYERLAQQSIAEVLNNHFAF